MLSHGGQLEKLIFNEREEPTFLRAEYYNVLGLEHFSFYYYLFFLI